MTKRERIFAELLHLGRSAQHVRARRGRGLIALKDGKMIVLRVPYPLGFYAKGFDGRIDDPSACWKGRGLWTTSGDRAPWLKEGGKGSKPIAVHFGRIRSPTDQRVDDGGSARGAAPSLYGVRADRPNRPARSAHAPAAHEGPYRYAASRWPRTRRKVRPRDNLPARRPARPQ